MGLGYVEKLAGRLPCAHGMASALAALCALWLPQQAQAQSQVSDTELAEARVAVLTPGTMLKLEDMDFGLIAKPLTAGTVVLAPLTSPTCNVTGGLVRTGTCQPAEFAVMGRNQDRVRIRELNGGVITLTGPGGATMRVTNLTIGTSNMAVTNGANGWTFGRHQITSSTGMATFRIGGRLNVNANQRAGVYTGTLRIEAGFN